MNKKDMELNKASGNKERNRPKISVVVPVYNVENYLSKCITCLIEQSLQEIEIICVDDASTDGSASILRDYAKKDNRIRIITHKENLSASMSRKDGALTAKGEYTLFVDPDDSIELGALEKIYTIAKEKNVEILHFGTNVVNNGVTDKQITWYENFSKPYHGYLYGEDVFRKCFETQEYRFNIWNKLILTTLCKKAMSEHTDVPLPKAQDLYAYFLISYYAKSYYGIEDKLYNYSFGGGISGGRTFTEEKFRRHCTHATIVYFIIDFLLNKHVLDKNYIAAYRIANNLINDNIASIQACGKTKVPFRAEKIFCEYWIFGEYISNLFDHVKSVSDNTCAKLLFEIMFKIFKNVSVKTRSMVLDRLIELEENYFDLINNLIATFDLQSKDYMFIQTIVAERRYHAQGENYVPIFMAADNNYIVYLGVTLNSIILNADKNYYYDVFILHTGIERYYINKLNNIRNENVSVNCINIRQIITAQSLYSNRHYSVDMYHRFLIPELFFFLEKVLYLDCDIIVQDSIHKLYNIDIGDSIIGAARNLLHNEMYTYVVNNLHLNPTKYINSGVLLINCQKYISAGIKNKCYSYLVKNQELMCPDQDALNMCCDRVTIIDNSWNFQWHHLLNEGIERYRLVPEDARIFERAKKHIKLIHYTSNKKPWNYCLSDYADIFWMYAKSSVFCFEVEHRYKDLNDPLNNKIKDLYKKIGILTKRLEELDSTKKENLFAKVRHFFANIAKAFKCLKNKGLRYTFIRIFCGKNKANTFENKRNAKVK